METQSLHVVQSGGDSLIRHRPTFSFDGKLLFCACASVIKVFSTETGDFVQRLLGHDSEVTSIVQHPTNQLQAISSSLDGTIKTWDYEDGILLRTYDVGRPLAGLYADSSIEKHVYMLVNDKDFGLLIRMSLEDLASENLSTEKDVETVSAAVVRKIPQPVGFLLSGKYVVFCKKDRICIRNEQDAQAYIEHESKIDGQITCLACHPTEDCFATGHVSGKIKFWHNVCPLKRKKTDKVVISTHHWHSTFVQDLVFTPGGASLLSFGAESVLVQWHYRQHGTEKSFLPRLGAPGRHIVTSRDGTLFASTHKDNSVMIITNYFTIKHTIEGFTAAHHIVSEISKGKILEYDWKSRSCVTTGKPGHLLFYQPSVDKQLYNLDITHENCIASDRDAEMSRSVITLVAFSQEPGRKTDLENFTWMATVEEVPGSSFLRDRKLKFWLFDEAEQWWRLNTIINDPHKSSVSGIVFRPGVSLCLLTVGLDGMAKIWEVQEKGQKSCSMFWSCFAAASYRQLPAHSGDFSQDGSVATVAFGHAVCLVSPDTLQDVSVLLSFNKGERVKHLLFGRHSCQHILMMALDSSLVACNLLSGVVTWSVDLKTDHLFRDPLSEVMGTLSATRDLYVFNPSSSNPLYMHENICGRDVLSAAFVPSMKVEGNSWLSGTSEVSWMQRSRIFLVDKNMAVYTLCTDGELDRKHNVSTAAGRLAANLESLKTPLASVLQKSSNKENVSQSVGHSVTEIAHQEQLAALRKITDTPCHVLPPMSTLCKDFVAAFLPKKQSTRESLWNDAESMEVEVDTPTEEPDSSRVAALEQLLGQIDLDGLGSRHFDFVAGLWT